MVFIISCSNPMSPEVPGLAESPSFRRMCRTTLLARIWSWKLLMPAKDNNYYSSSLWGIYVDFLLDQCHENENRIQFVLVHFNRKFFCNFFLISFNASFMWNTQKRAKSEPRTSNFLDHRILPQTSTFPPPTQYCLFDNANWPNYPFVLLSNLMSPHMSLKAITILNQHLQYFLNIATTLKLTAQYAFIRKKTQKEIETEKF